MNTQSKAGVTLSHAGCAEIPLSGEGGSSVSILSDEGNVRRAYAPTPTSLRRYHLMRRLQSSDFEQVQPEQVGWKAWLLSSLAFAAARGTGVRSG